MTGVPLEWWAGGAMRDRPLPIVRGSGIEHAERPLPARPRYEQFRVPALAGPVRLTRREWTAAGWFSGGLSINTHCRVDVALHEEGSVTLLKKVNAWDRALAAEYRGVVG